MTRRIAWAILLTCWTVLLVGGLAAYLLARRTMLAELDADIISDAMALPQLAVASAGKVQPEIPMGDRFLIVGPGERKLSRSLPQGEGTAPKVVSRAFVTLADGITYRTVTLAVPMRDADDRPGELRVIYSTPAERFEELMRQLAFSLSAAGGICAVATALVARRVSRKAIAPIRDCAAALGEIEPRTLHRRIDTRRLPEELLQVAERLNDMLHRLEEGFARQQRFLADAAHELRTPVAALLTTLEVTLRRPRDPHALLEALRDSLADTVLLKRLTDALLQQARATAPVAPVLQWVELAPLLEQCLGLARTLAARNEVTVEARYAAAMSFCTDPARLQSILTNLLSNAIEYNHPGGRVAFDVEAGNGELVIRVGNTGPGVAAEHLPRVFDAFHRPAGAPGGQEHLGLGLHLVKTQIEALRGHCQVRSEVGQWTEFIVRLPDPEGAPIPTAAGSVSSSS